MDGNSEQRLRHLAGHAMTSSVIIATKNRHNELLDTIASLLEQSCRPDEVIIIDQSGDPSAQHAVTQLVGVTFPLRYIHDVTIHGAASARNRGIGLATGDVIIFLDDDVALEPDFLHQLLSVYHRDPAVGGVSGIIINYDRPPLWQRILLQAFWLGPFHDERQPIYWNADRLRGHEPVVVRKFGTTAMSLRRQVLGPLRFDERLRGAWPGEDVDLCCRLPWGTRLVIAPRARFVHKRTPTNRPSAHWLKGDVHAMYYLYRRNWVGTLRHLLCFVWLNVGYTLAATLSSAHRFSLEPWRTFLQARRDAGEYERPRWLSRAPLPTQGRAGL